MPVKTEDEIADIVGVLAGKEAQRCDTKGPTPLTAEEQTILKYGRCVSCMEPVNPLHPKCACIRAELTELQREIEGYRQALAQRGHVAEFREDGWSLEHPVECRAIGL